MVETFSVWLEIELLQASILHIAGKASYAALS